MGDGGDVFVHIKDCKDGMCPRQGDVLTYDLGEGHGNKDKPVAINVTGGSAKQTQDGAAVIVNGTGAHEATVKSFNPQKGFGFIEMEGYEGGLFFIGKSCIGSYPWAGDLVKFDIEDNPQKPGQSVAVNITGGTAPLGRHPNPKGKGKGKMDMMAMMMMMMMGGKGGGKGKW